MVLSGHDVSRQRGQALTEVVLSLLLVLIPIFIFGWVLYAYGQARTTALNGARYAAWERTVWREGAVNGAAAAVRSPGEIGDSMMTRFFGKPEAAIKSNAASGLSNKDLPSFYSVHTGDKVIDVEGGDVGAPKLVSLAENGKTTSTIASLYNNIAKVLSFLGGSTPSLEKNGIYVAKVNVPLKNVRNVAVFDSLNLGLTQTAAALADGWSAGGKQHEEAIVEPLVPASKFGELTDVFTLLGPFTPFENFKPGCIRGDIVPSDTLPKGTRQATGLCN
ncbi:MAG: hypothetical protein LBP94_07260 [Zoogloeaceae bacterium]|jgi:hypothetical protein|nr:hypothetical protein [Zoogloeaceae bacterium]